MSKFVCIEINEKAKLFDFVKQKALYSRGVERAYITLEIRTTDPDPVFLKGRIRNEFEHLDLEHRTKIRTPLKICKHRSFDQIYSKV